MTNDVTTHGSTAIDGEERRRRGFPLWLAALLGLALIGLLLFLLTRGGEGDETAETSATSTGAEAGAEAGTGAEGEAVAGAEAAAEGEAAPAPEAAEVGAGALTAGGTGLLSLPATGLGAFAEQTVEAAGAPVQSVVSDEGFWVGPNEGSRIFVQLPTQGQESAPAIEPGQLLEFDGTLRPLPEGWTETFGVSPAEGAALLAEQGHYIQAPAVTIR